MSFSPIPGRVVDSIFDLSPASLHAAGIRLILCDLDNTLAPYEQSTPSPALLEWKQALEEQGISLFVISNSRKSRRCPDFCDALAVPYLRHAGKPGTRAIREALARSGIPPVQAILVGDQIFTDILGANRAGVASVLVRPMAWGKNPLRRLRYAAETPFRLAGKRR